jgi:hypothetical protein
MIEGKKDRSRTFMGDREKTHAGMQMKGGERARELGRGKIRA